jgi:hypothetical protein
MFASLASSAASHHRRRHGSATLGAIPPSTLGGFGRGPTMAVRRGEGQREAAGKRFAQSSRIAHGIAAIGDAPYDQLSL